ncbi:A/G-specific adenine glycosylase [Alphaproteobacteria bacterium]|nr:A/G-specific adenine glycosylase [Alphaproteobacteria bacterium]
MYNFLNINKSLLKWYKFNKRILPWRVLSEAKPDPYKIWISEIMLQQTTVATVLKRYESFISKWKNVNELANSSIDEILYEWQGLGYYSRAHNIHKTSKIILNKYNSIFPVNYRDLKSLPGVGEYTASAILAIAFNKPYMPVDVNISRVISRVFAIARPILNAKKEINIISKVFLLDGKAGDLAQALMDLGSLVCKPKKPLCNKCPINSYCIAYNRNIVETLPLIKLKSPKAKKYGYIFLVQKKDGSVMIRKKKNEGLFKGMMEIPSSPWMQEDLAFEAVKRYAPFKAEWKKTDIRVSYDISNFKLELKVFKCVSSINKRGIWVKPGKYENYAVPSLMKKVFNQLEVKRK